MVEKVSAFFVGNVVGLTILVGGVLLTAPKKLKESEIIQKQEEARKAQAAQATKDSTEPENSASARGPGSTADLVTSKGPKSTADLATSKGPESTADLATSKGPPSTEKPAKAKDPLDRTDLTAANNADSRQGLIAATDSNQFGSSSKTLAPYVVSRVNIARGEKIDVSAVKLVELPTKENQDALSNVESVVGKTTIVDIHAGNTITAKALKN